MTTTKKANREPPRKPSEPLPARQIMTDYDGQGSFFENYAEYRFPETDVGFSEKKPFLHRRRF